MKAEREPALRKVNIRLATILGLFALGLFLWFVFVGGR